MEELRFQEVESNEQKEQAGALIREYLEWLNGRVKRDYGIEFDVNAMVESDLADRDKFELPRFCIQEVKRFRELASLSTNVLCLFRPLGG